jgi:hypothetical protein
MTLYFISAKTDDGDSLDWHVSARNPRQAYLLWETEHTVARWCTTGTEVTVFPVAPSDTKKPCVHAWDHDNSKTYKA